jgi:hypothetical protein
MTRPGSLVAAGLLLALAASCLSGGSAGEPKKQGQEQEPGVFLVANAAAYSGGDQVRLTLTNRTATRVGYNICFAFLNIERDEAGTWSPFRADLGPGGNVACTAQLHFMAPGASAEGVAHLPKDLKLGSYRITYEAEVDGTRVKTATEAFTVG